VAKRFSRRKLVDALAGLGDVRIVPKKDRELRVISTGVDALDVATGVGGYPLGRCIIHHGAPASGKSSAALHACASFQGSGGVAFYLDFERKMDFGYAAALGVDVDAMVYPRAKLASVEAGFAAIEKVIGRVREQDEVPVLIVWDSLQSVASMSEGGRDYDATGWAGEAQAYSRCLRKIIPLIHDTGALLMMISQVRMDLGSPAPGAQRIGVGQAPLFYATQAFIWKQVGGYGRAKEAARGASDRVGQLTEIEVRKNQVAPPFVRVKVPVVFGHGIDRAGSLFEAAEVLGRAKVKGGGWAEIDIGEAEPLKVRGIGGLRKMLEDDPAEYERVRQIILHGPPS